MCLTRRPKVGSEKEWTLILPYRPPSSYCIYRIACYECFRSTTCGLCSVCGLKLFVSFQFVTVEGGRRNWRQELGGRYSENRTAVYILSLTWVKGKATPLQAWTGPEGSRRLRLPDFKTVGTWRWHRPPLPSRKYSWYSFLLESESTPGRQCGRKDYVNGKLQRHHRESNPRPSVL